MWQHACIRYSATDERTHSGINSVLRAGSSALCLRYVYPLPFFISTDTFYPAPRSVSSTLERFSIEFYRDIQNTAICTDDYVAREGDFNFAVLLRVIVTGGSKKNETFTMGHFETRDKYLDPMSSCGNACLTMVGTHLQK